MMEHYGFLSIVCPVVAIILAIRTKQVYTALIAGLLIGYMVICKGNPLAATEQMLLGLVQVFADAGNTKTIIFSALIGAVLIYIQISGGVAGFVQFLEKRIQNLSVGNNAAKRKVQWLAFYSGLIIFVESNISVLTAGTLFRPIFDKLRISRERLAYIIDSSSAPICILLPFNGWGAVVMALLASQQIEAPFQTLIKSIPYNLYAIFALLVLLVSLYGKLDFKAMKKADARTATTGKYLWDDAQPMVSDEVTQVDPKPGLKAKAYNMLIPLLCLLLFVPTFLAYTGWQDAASAGEGINRFFVAITQGSGSSAVLYAVVAVLVVCISMYSIQGMFSLREHNDIIMKGIQGLIPIALLLLFAFALGALCTKLGTGIYLAEVCKQWLSPALLPLLIFLFSGFVAFSTGTSWGTFAIMIPIAIPMAEVLGASDILVIGAVLSGGIFGDHCSPISDTTILSSMASATDHIDHVKTQLPYALTAGILASIGYLILGLAI